MTVDVRYCHNTYLPARSNYQDTRGQTQSSARSPTQTILNHPEANSIFLPLHSFHISYNYIQGVPQLLRLFFPIGILSN